MKRNRTNSPARSLQSRLTRLIVFIVMGTFVIIGVIALFGIRANARAELSLDHRTQLFDVRNTMSGTFQDIFSDLRRIASSPSTRTFANETVSISTVSNESQQRLISEFVNLLQQNPGLYAEARYVTRTGSVWTEVSNYDGIRTNTQVSLDELTNDDALVYSLRQMSGNAVLGQILFQRDDAGAMIRPPVPLLRFSAPVSLPNNVESLAGVVQIDVFANPILDIVNEHELTLPGRRFIVVMAPGQTIADTLAPEDTFPARGVSGQSSSFSFNEPELDQIVRNATADFTFAERGGRVFSATQISLENSPTMPWFLLLTDDAALALGRADALGIAAFVASLFLGGLISLLAVTLLRRMLRPLDAATSLARQMTTGDQRAPVSIGDVASNDEIADVMRAFADLNARVEALTQELETQVGRYSRNLEIAARVGRETATLHEMEPLLNRAISLIVEEFGYYHAQVFLVDDVGQNALLRYSYGTLGQRLLEQAHKIAVGTQSVIGQVTATAAPVVVNDTENDPGPHRYNPLLPDTRAEMAVPLQIGDRVIGALDIQSLTPNVFGDDDVQTFQLLADQIAAAINNAQLLQQTGERVEQIDNLNRQLTRSAWSDAENRLGLGAGYTYDLFDVVQTPPAPATDGDAAAPIAIRGEVVGAIAATAPDGQPFSEAEVAIMRAVADRVALAIENARLFQETESALDETRRLYETSRAITSAADAREIYGASVEALGGARSNISHITVMTATPTNTLDATHLQVDYLWRAPWADSTVTRVGARFPTKEVPYLRLTADAGGPVVLHDLRHDLADYPGLRVLLDENYTQSLLVVAIRSGGKWIGALALESEQQQAFDESFARYVQAVADQLAVAIDNRRLFEEAQLEAKRALALAEVGQLANRVGTAFGSSIGEVFVRVAEPAGYDRWMLGLTDESGQNLVIVNQYQPELDDLPASFELGETSMHSLVDAAQQNRTIIVNNSSGYPAFAQYSLDYAQSVGRHIVTPVVIGETVVGALMVGRRRDALPLDSRDEQLVTTLAAQVAVALENQRLFRSTETALQETSLLYEASRALGDAATDEDMVGVVARYLADDETHLVFLTTLSGSDWSTPGVGAQIAASWQRNGDDDLELENLSLPAQQFPAWQQFAEADLLLVENVSTDPRLTPADRLGLFGMDMKAVAILPLRAGRRDLGALVLGWPEPRRFDERDERVYSAFAEQASLKLEASRLLTQTERRARQLATSAEVGRVASTILNLDQLLPRIVDLIRDAFGYDHTQIFLMSDDDEYAELRASTGEAGRQLLAIQHKLAKGSQSVIGQVTATGEPSIALDTRAASVIHRPNPYLPDTRSEMAVPLVIKGHVVGALDVQSNQPNAFDEDDVAVLTTLATQISVSIDNARLFEQAGRRANEMTFLFNVTTAAASADTLDHALHNVARELLASLDALSVSIYLPEVYDTDDVSRMVLRPVALAGPDQPLSELSDIEVDPESDNLIAAIAGTRQPTILDHVDQVQGYIPAVHGAQAAVVVPLTSANRLIGLVAVEAEAPEAYDNQTLTLLLTLSGTLSAIVQNQQLLEQLQETNDQLRELDKLKSDFLANMSHELRTPLNSIIGFSRVILKGIDGPLTEMQEQDLTTIYNSGQHLLNLINDILDQAKISAQKMELQIEPFAVKPVIDAVRSIGIGLIKDKPIDIIVDLASGLPQAYGDELRTRQILLNLVSNAAKFTREGSITLRAYPETDPATGMRFVRIDVADTGIGIAEQDIPLLFEAFRQVDSSLTRTVGGTGLGLPIARSLCEMQGGTLLVTSEVNVGSTFSVLVPAEPAAQPELPASNGHDEEEIEVISSQMETRPALHTKPLPSMETAMLPMLTKRQILLIEDNPDMVDQFRRILGREGFDIFAATITLEAEAMASGLHPTIIIMDVNFAGGVGWDMLERLKSRDDTLDIPIIVVTLSEEVDKALEAGAFRVIQRPFMPEVLTQAVQDAERESRIDRILIIDDQPESVRLLQQILQEHGDYRVFGAHSGQDGIALVARRRPNLIILDLRMPEMDGFAVVEELRSNPETANIPILVVTGETLTEAERERLSNLDVMHKTDINLEAYPEFMEGVKTHLARTNGVH